MANYNYNLFACNSIILIFNEISLQVWLSKLSEEMVDTLQELLRTCLKDAQRGDLDPNKYPSQVKHNGILVIVDP